MSKYEPLARLLSTRTEAEVPLTFEAIEAALGAALPASARTYHAWWANEGKTHTQARAWLEAGWRLSSVDLEHGVASFERCAGSDAARPSPDDRLIVDRGKLSSLATKLLGEYVAEAQGDVSTALSRALEEAALARRRTLIERLRAASPKAPDNSADLIREDRDAR